MKLGVVGEDPNDSHSLINLLTSYFATQRHSYYVLLHEVTGDNLNTKKARKLIKIAYLNEKPDFVLYTRDLDDLSSNTSKIKERRKEFEELQKYINGMGVFLLNIFELETLILSDIDSFNKYYGVNLRKVARPMTIIEPKELLKDKTNHKEIPYHESHNKEVFAVLNPTVIKENCDYFRDFLAKLLVLGVK